MNRLLLPVFLLLNLAEVGSAQTIKGTIKKVDLEVGTLSIRPFFQEEDRDLSLASKDIPVRDTLGQPAQLKDLHVGSRVTLKYEGEFVTELTYQGPHLWGHLRKVDLDKRLVEIEDPIRTHRIVLPATTVVRQDKAEKSLKDLKLDQPAQVLFTPDGKTPVELLTGRSVTSRDPYLRTRLVQAVLLESNPETRTLTLLNRPAGEPMRVEKMTTTPEVAIRVEFSQRRVRDVSFTEIKTGPLTVNLIVDYETKLVDGIVIEAPTYSRRKLLELDLEKHTLTIEEGKEKRTLNLDPEAIVFLNSKGTAKLSDLKIGTNVICALSPDQSRVIALVWYPR